MRHISVFGSHDAPDVGKTLHAGRSEPLTERISGHKETPEEIEKAKKILAGLSKKKDGWHSR